MTKIPGFGGTDAANVTSTRGSAPGIAVTEFPSERLAVPIDEAAPLLDISYNTLWRAVRENQFAGVRIRDRIVIPMAALGSFQGSLGPVHQTASLAIGLHGAARLIGVSYNTLWRASTEDHFPTTRIRSRILVPRFALDSLLGAAVAEAGLIDTAAWTTEWRKSITAESLAA